MRSTLAFVAVLALLTLVEIGASRAEYKSAFVKSLNKLHRGPPELPSYRANVKTKWITQKMDHFDAKNGDEWEMRYLVNEEHFKDGGPMFIHLGGEWSISPSAITTGIFSDLAKEHEGILFYTEHRFYGRSRPTSNITAENLQKFLHVKQALADVAHFIRYQRSTDPRLANSKVILSGGSYSATMVVWFSKLYPELVAGGWASSAPILAKVDFKEYKEVTGRALRELGSPQCHDRVKNGIAELEALFDGKRAAEGKAMLQLCNSFDHNNDFDLWTLFSTISNLFARYVQYQKTGDIDKLCNHLMSTPDDLIAISSFFLEQISDGKDCIDATYESTVKDYSDVTYNNGASRPWFFQTCNEYGWYQSSASKEQPFGTKFPATLNLHLCYDIFGPQYTHQHIHALVDETNANFGGLNPQVKNVYMTHGALDPWSAMGHNETHGASVIPLTSHCADYGSISKYDSAEMRASKERLVQLVKEWLA